MTVLYSFFFKLWYMKCFIKMMRQAIVLWKVALCVCHCVCGCVSVCVHVCVCVCAHSCSRDGIQGLPHAEHMLHHWAFPPAPRWVPFLRLVFPWSGRAPCPCFGCTTPSIHGTHARPTVHVVNSRSPMCGLSILSENRLSSAHTQGAWPKLTMSQSRMQSGPKVTSEPLPPDRQPLGTHYSIHARPPGL
jgi:hypothetical protein